MQVVQRVHLENLIPDCHGGGLLRCEQVMVFGAVDDFSLDFGKVGW
jgi:hypothetical protein